MEEEEEEEEVDVMEGTMQAAESGTMQIQYVVVHPRDISGVIVSFNGHEGENEEWVCIELVI